MITVTVGDDTVTIPDLYTRPAGTGYVTYETIAKTQTPSLTMGTSTNKLTFPAGDFTGLWSDLLEAAGNDGIWFRNAGVFGSGVDQTIIGIKANSATKVAPQGARGSGTNNYYMMRIDGATELAGLTLRGLPQATLKYFGGLIVYQGRNGYVHDFGVEAWAGFDSAPPGETGGINNYKSIGETFRRIFTRGGTTGPSGFMSNMSTDTLVEDSLFDHAAYGANVALYKETRGVIRNTTVSNCVRGINVEQQTGALTIDRCTFRGNTKDISIASNGQYPTGTFEIIEPDFVGSLKINLGGSYNDFQGNPNGTTTTLTWDAINVTIGGVRKPAKTWGTLVTAI